MAQSLFRHAYEIITNPSQLKLFPRREFHRVAPSRDNPKSCIVCLAASLPKAGIVTNWQNATFRYARDVRDLGKREPINPVAGHSPIFISRSICRVLLSTLNSPDLIQLLF